MSLGSGKVILHRLVQASPSFEDIRRTDLGLVDYLTMLDSGKHL